MAPRSPSIWIATGSSMYECSDSKLRACSAALSNQRVTLPRLTRYSRATLACACGARPQAYLGDALVSVASTPASHVVSLTLWALAAERVAVETPVG